MRDLLIHDLKRIARKMRAAGDRDDLIISEAICELQDLTAKHATTCAYLKELIEKEQSNGKH